MDRPDIALRLDYSQITAAHDLRRAHAVEYARRIVEALAPACIILFGSVAKGTDNAWSDIDLVVVGGDLPANIFDRFGRVNALKRGLSTPADAFPYTEAEFEQMLDNLHVTALDCMYEGQVLHGQDYFDRLRPKFEAYVARGLTRGKAAWYFEKKQVVGLFITFEGPDGSGKSTQIKQLAEYLTSLGQNVLLTREPGGTEISEQIRAVLHDLKNKAMQPRAEILLYSAARAQLVGEKIKPHLARGGIVLSDRYADSTLAYQGYGHGLDLAALRLITAFATDGLKPDLTLLFDLDAATGLQRRQKSGGEWNRMDELAPAFHQRVRNGYLELVKVEPERWVVLDATQEVDELQEEVRKVIKQKSEARS